jgi:hypothetical protein
MDETTLLFDTGKGNKRRLINIKDIARSYSEEYRSSLLGLHAFCGCDTTSAFKGKGHVGPIKLLKKYPRFMRPLSQLGIEWEVSKGLLDELEEFTCAIYGHNSFSSVDKLRVNKFKQKCEGKATDASRNIDLSLLPPCKKALEQHIKRVNYQVGIWKRSHEAKPVIPHPDGHGWIDEDGTLEPLWFRREELIPEELTHILIESIDSTAQTESENEDYEDHISDDDENDDDDDDYDYDDEEVICEESDYE